jgi:hypothetical protein
MTRLTPGGADKAWDKQLLCLQALVEHQVLVFLGKVVSEVIVVAVAITQTVVKVTYHTV